MVREALNVYKRLLAAYVAPAGYRRNSVLPLVLRTWQAFLLKVGAGIKRFERRLYSLHFQKARRYLENKLSRL